MKGEILMPKEDKMKGQVIFSEKELKRLIKDLGVTRGLVIGMTPGKSVAEFNLTDIIGGLREKMKTNLEYKDVFKTK